MTLAPRALRALLCTLALALLSPLSLAEKPAHAGGGHGDHPGKADKHRGKGPGGDHDHATRERAAAPRGDAAPVSVHVQIGGYFTDVQRRAVVDYYEPQFRAGRCPPGLAKQHNGCMPPGQAKKWRKGYPLPRDVVYYPVPEGISIRLGLPPSGHKYVRVATDILLIAIGTGMVIDAIDDLGRL